MKPQIKVKVTLDVDSSIKSFHKVTPNEELNEHNGQDDSRVFYCDKVLQLAQVLGDIKNHYKSPSDRTTPIIQNKVSAVRNERQSSHGKSKMLKEPYFRMRPSVLDQVQHLGKQYQA